MAKIYAPNGDYCGVSAGVTFADGVGQCADEGRLDWFRQRGYRVVGTAAKPAKDGKAAVKRGGRTENAA